MNLEQLLQAGVHRADLMTVDSHFSAIGIGDSTGLVHLKAGLIALANVADFEASVGLTYMTHAEPSELIKPLRKKLEFAKYLRNKYVGHIHPELVGKAIEWQPMLRSAVRDLGDPKVALIVNLWLLEAAINTYVDKKGEHKIFSSETDLMYPPDWARFLEYLETTIRGCIGYLEKFTEVWSPQILPASTEAFDLELALKAGKTEFKFLTK